MRFRTFRVRSHGLWFPLFTLALPIGLGICSPAAAQDVLTFHNDATRSGVQSAETVLNKSIVNSTQFGKVLTFPVTGDVYAQPLYVTQYLMADGKLHNVLIVATAQDNIYAFDADGNNPVSGYLWEVTLLNAGETWLTPADVTSTGISPAIGIIGTPVIDRSGGIVYVVSNSKMATGAPNYAQRLHALNLADGTEKLNGPTTIQATVPGTGDGSSTITFNSPIENQRSALLLAPTPSGSSANSIFIAWGSHGDDGPYHGWVISYNAANISQQTGAWCVTPNGGGGGIWMSGGGLSTDGQGAIFGGSGNGVFDANLNGTDFSDSMFKLTLSPTGIAVSDWFTPYNQQALSNSDLDFGVGGAPLILPTQTGPYPHVMVTADKQGGIYLLNRDNLGHYNGSTNTSIQSFTDGGQFPIHSNLVFFNNGLYLIPSGAPATLWSFNPSTELFNTVPASQSTHVFPCTGYCSGNSGSNFTISANGSQNGIIWALDYSQAYSGPAVLYAFDSTNLSTELYDTTQAPNQRDQAAVAIKFSAPTVANGKVFVPGRNAVTAYGVLPGLPVATTPTLSPAGGSFTSAQTVTIADTTLGSTIYYTTNGSAPTTGSSVYTTPLLIGTTTPLQAMAIATGYTNSLVAAGTYTITLPVVNFSGGFTGATMAMNGSTTLASGRLRLTNGGMNERSSAYYPVPVNVQEFSTTFVFQLTNPNADGFTFTVQNAGTKAMGLGGGGLGYASDLPDNIKGVPLSVAIKFDLYNSAGEGPNSTGMYTNGAAPKLPAVNLTGTGINLHSGHLFQTQISYNGTTLTVTITDQVTLASATQNYTINIPATVGATTAYIGFTAGTGSLTSTQDIVTWTYTN